MVVARPVDDPPGAWWENRALLAALILLTMLPLLWPNVPPLVDLPGHMGRYHVQMEIGRSPVIQSFYDFKWALIGNLGLDLLVIPLAKLFGLELAVKLIVIAIPAMTVAGFLWVAREVHGRVPPTAFFALPLVYNFPFMFGFVNFALSMAFVFLAFAFWLRLARLGHLRLRAALFVPISVLIWFTHAFGWGTLGVMAFSAELVRQIDLRRPILKGGMKTLLHCLALAPPLALMLLWRSGEHVGGKTTDFFNWNRKLDWLLMVFRDRYYYFDMASLAVIGGVLLIGLLWWKRLQYSRNLAASAIFLAIVYICLPRIVFGSAYADMRLAPFVVAVAVIAIRFHRRPAGKLGSVIAVAGLAFFAARTAGTTISFWQFDRTYDRELAALDHVPRGAKLVTFIGRTCREKWRMSRLEHISALALVRRDAFSNDQWAMPGAQLLTVDYPGPKTFTGDPSQMVTPAFCRGEAWRPIDRALAFLPREAFDYVWLVRPPVYDPGLTRGLQPIWRSDTSVLYRIIDRGRPSAPLQGR
jgi:hypothetical protein